jgi:hypothetical protein
MSYGGEKTLISDWGMDSPRGLLDEVSKFHVPPVQFAPIRLWI